jgi:hypothetical protein
MRSKGRCQAIVRGRQERCVPEQAQTKRVARVVAIVINGDDLVATICATYTGSSTTSHYDARIHGRATRTSHRALWGLDPGPSAPRRLGGEQRAERGHGVAELAVGLPAPQTGDSPMLIRALELRHSLRHSRADIHLQKKNKQSVDQSFDAITSDVGQRKKTTK